MEDKLMTLVEFVEVMKLLVSDAMVSQDLDYYGISVEFVMVIICV